MQSPPLSYSQELIENEEFLSLGSSSSLYIQESSVIQITHEQQSSESQQEEQIIIQDMSFQSQRTQDGVTTTEEQDDDEEQKLLIDESHNCLVRRIYHLSNKRFNIEMCLRLEDLIIMRRISLAHLNISKLVDVLHEIEKTDIDILEEFIDESNEDDRYELLYYRLLCRKEKAKLKQNNRREEEAERESEPSVAAVAASCATESTAESQVSPASASTSAVAKTPLEADSDELEKLGYEYLDSKSSRIIKLRIFTKDENNNDKKIEGFKDNETLEFPDPKNCYGVKLSRTRYGKRCFVKILRRNKSKTDEENRNEEKKVEENKDDDEVERNFELDLLKLFILNGRVLEMKIDRDRSSSLRSRIIRNVIVTYTTRLAVQSAIRNLDGYMFNGDSQMSVEDTPSFEANTKVCLMNLPVNITFDSLRSILCRKFDGIRHLDLIYPVNLYNQRSTQHYAGSQIKAFVDFIDNSYARIFYESLTSDPSSLFSSCYLRVRWYDLDNHPMLRVSFLRHDTTEDSLREFFANFGRIIWFKKEWPNFFVKLESDIDNLIASDELNNTYLNGQKIRVLLTRSTDFESKFEQRGFVDSSQGYVTARSSSGFQRHQSEVIRARRVPFGNLVNVTAPVTVTATGDLDLRKTQQLGSATSSTSSPGNDATSSTRIKRSWSESSGESTSNFKRCRKNNP